LIAVNKPSGQAVIPGRGLAETPLVEQVSTHLGTKAFVVHRIDRETSGLVVFAKDAETHRQLSGLWEDREVRKTYQAWVLGTLKQAVGVFQGSIKEFGSGRMGVHPKGKPSQTRYRLVRTGPQGSLLEVEPLTGRKHQIRVHLYHAGHPVLGDSVYGEARPVGGYSRLLLHAYRLEIPWEGKTLTLQAEPPADFAAF
jgi:RluA family pseudouridine synthase